MEINPRIQRKLFFTTVTVTVVHRKDCEAKKEKKMETENPDKQVMKQFKLMTLAGRKRGLGRD